MPRQIRWYDMLTLDHTVCRLCFSLPRVGNVLSMRQIALLDGKPIKGDRSTRRQPYVMGLRATLRRHIARNHPEYVDRVLWKKD